MKAEEPNASGGTGGAVLTLKRTPAGSVIVLPPIPQAFVFVSASGSASRFGTAEEAVAAMEAAAQPEGTK